MRGGLAVALALLLAATLALPVVAHGNLVSADAQRSANGTVVVEAGFTVVDGWVALYATNGSGAPTTVVGRTALDRADGFRTDLTVEADAAAWRNWTGNRTVVAALHRDDGDGTFDPEADPRVRQRGEPVSEAFALGKGDHAAYVTAETFEPQPATNLTVQVRSVALPRAGYVVVRARTDDGPGTVVGTAAVPAGRTEAVPVGLDPSFVRARDDRFRVTAVAYTDDGDGTFDDGDAPVRVGGERVMTSFAVAKPDDLSVSPTATGTAHDHEQTPTAPSPTATPRPAPTTAPDRTTPATPTPVPSPGGTSPGAGPGFGVVGALVAVVLAAVALRRGRN